MKTTDNRAGPLRRFFRVFRVFRGQPTPSVRSDSPSFRLSGRCLLIAAATLFACGAGITWWIGQRAPAPRAAAQPATPPKTGIVATATDSHRASETVTVAGVARPRPADPALVEALSLTSRLEFTSRLKAVHALTGKALTEDQAAAMRAFVADPAIPEGVTLPQIRALKNDVLNVLCLHPGGEAATAAMLRALHADETADPGLRDYALQHLVTLTERTPDLGWETHWAAVEGDDPALAATAMLHIAIQLRASGSPSSDHARLARAALRVASDETAKYPARTTALQVCGRLKVIEARPLAHAIARDERAGFPLRIAAVATLGDLGGDAETQAYLTGLTTGPEKRLRIPAQSALQRFPSN